MLTNLANGTTLTSTARVIEKDLRITDSGNGTVTVLIQATGNATLYGANGKAIARNPGQVSTRARLRRERCGRSAAES